VTRTEYLSFIRISAILAVGPPGCLARGVSSSFAPRAGRKKLRADSFVLILPTKESTKQIRIPRTTEPECDQRCAGQRPKRAADYDNIPPARPHQGNSSSTRTPQKRVTAEHAARRRTKRRIGDRTHNLGVGSAYHTVGVREPDHPSKSPKKFQCRRAVMQTEPCMEIGELLELDRFE
jgi:hypothetical protein